MDEHTSILNAHDPVVVYCGLCIKSSLPSAIVSEAGIRHFDSQVCSFHGRMVIKVVWRATHY